MVNYYQPTIDQISERIQELEAELIHLKARFMDNPPLKELIQIHIKTEINALLKIIERNSIP